MYSAENLSKEEMEELYAEPKIISTTKRTWQNNRQQPKRSAITKIQNAEQFAGLIRPLVYIRDTPPARVVILNPKAPQESYVCTAAYCRRH